MGESAVGLNHSENPARAGHRLPPNRLDFVRFLLASLVILSHSYPVATGTEDFEPLVRLTHHQLTFGTLAVDGFFIISGFLILHSWLKRPDWRWFLSKRIRRIYPGFLLVASLGALVIAPLTSKEGYGAVTPAFLLDLGLNLPRLQAPTPSAAFVGNPAAGPVNGSLWSIPFEFWCYIGVLTLGLAGLAVKRRLLVMFLALSILVNFVFVWFNLRISGNILGVIFGYPPFWARVLPFFLAGMVYYSYRESIPLNKKGAMFSLIALTTASQIPNGLIFALPFAATYLIFWFALLPGSYLRNFAKFGDFSYGIYLYSFPILQLIVWTHDGPIAPLPVFFIAWPTSVIFGILSWHLLEKYFLREKPKANARMEIATGRV